jgi:hypothetical protein
MFVEFSVTPVEYGCLLKNANRTTSAFPPLLNAVLELSTTTKWLINCRPLDEHGQAIDVMEALKRSRERVPAKKRLAISLDQ